MAESSVTRARYTLDGVAAELDRTRFRRTYLSEDRMRVLAESIRNALLVYDDALTPRRDEPPTPT